MTCNSTFVLHVAIYNINLLTSGTKKRLGCKTLLPPGDRFEHGLVIKLHVEESDFKLLCVCTLLFVAAIISHLHEVAV